MRTLKISLLVFILPVFQFAQQDNLIHYDKTLLTPFLIQTNDNPAQKLKQELNQIKNKFNSTQLINEYYLIDSLVSKGTDGSRYKFLFEYNQYGKMVERTGFFSYSGELEIFEKVEYFYNTNNNLIKELYFEWFNAKLDSLIQLLYEYNQDNNLISTTVQSYVSSNWENEARTTNTYDQTGNQITSLNELWQNSQWTNSSMVYNYYSQGNRRDSLLLQKWDGNNWQNFSRSSFYYDSLTAFLNYVISQLWTGNKFQDSFKLNIINDELGNQIQQLEEIWNGSGWVNDIKRDYTYIWNYFESCNAELWNGTNWEPGDTPILVNNPDGFKIAIVSQSINAYYIIVNVGSSNSNTLNEFSLSQNYPYPFNPITKIKYSIPSVTLRQAQSDILVALIVYDILGREVATLVNEEKPAGEYEVEFNGNNLPSGIYFYQLKASQFSETRKMVLLR